VEEGKERERERERRAGEGWKIRKRQVERDRKKVRSRVESGWVGKIITRDLARGSPLCILSLFLGSLRVSRSLFLLCLLHNQTQRERHQVDSVYSPS
jgi:hypothetical protein